LKRSHNLTTDKTDHCARQKFPLMMWFFPSDTGAKFKQTKWSTALATNAEVEAGNVAVARPTTTTGLI
jgi:hypothetical protein